MSLAAPPQPSARSERGRAGPSQERLTEQEVLRRLSEQFGPRLTDLAISGRCEVSARTEREQVFAVCKVLKEQLGFDHCSLISAVDYKTHFECVYHLHSTIHQLIFVLKTPLPHDDPIVDSVTPLWQGANWHECEAYDMMGFVFRGHPNLKRVYLPPDTDFFPLRKDYRFGQ